MGEQISQGTSGTRVEKKAENVKVSSYDNAKTSVGVNWH